MRDAVPGLFTILALICPLFAGAGHVVGILPAPRGGTAALPQAARNSL